MHHTESSSSLRSLARRTLILKGTPLTPWAQMALLSLVLILTCLVPICFLENFLISCRKKLYKPTTRNSYRPLHHEEPCTWNQSHGGIVCVDDVLAGHHLPHGGGSLLFLAGHFGFWNFRIFFQTKPTKYHKLSFHWFLNSLAQSFLITFSERVDNGNHEISHHN